MNARTPMIIETNLENLIGKKVVNEDGYTGVILIDPSNPHFPILVEFDDHALPYLAYDCDGYEYDGSFDMCYIKLV
jgi:hypothetical protein